MNVETVKRGRRMREGEAAGGCGEGWPGGRERGEHGAGGTRHTRVHPEAASLASARRGQRVGTQSLLSSPADLTPRSNSATFLCLGGRRELILY
ncbi:hypothetical protein E2C01_013962 [Portunus trituberculatus]|uniref:Uncharacterized protein n=1 Tax=Portunus trituberculatus TaxID=210409 RepID=A0A5B7DIV5_PORTR|nr:hypothetical protein [Portunus trituberculatus]